MSWWLGPSILFVVLLGILAGIVISRQIVRAQKKSPSVFPRQNFLTSSGSSGDPFFKASPVVEKLPLRSQTMERQPVSSQPEVRAVVENLPARYQIVEHKKVSSQAEIQRAVENLPTKSQIVERKKISSPPEVNEAVVTTPAKRQTVERKKVSGPPEGDRVKVYLDARANAESPKAPVSPAFKELQNNLSIAKRPLTNHLVNFEMTIWNTRRSEFSAVNETLMRELTEAYVDMNLANNVVWLVMELGRDSQDLKDSYSSLKNKVSERLQRILPEIRASFK
jgi:hypothetical protein